MLAKLRVVSPLRKALRPLSTYDAKWETLVRKELAGMRGPESLEKVTPENIILKPVYTAKDAQVTEEYPGVFPYTRGPYGSMYTAKPWTVRQYAGFSTAEESNAFYKKVLFPSSHISMLFSLFLVILESCGRSTRSFCSI